MYFLLYVNVDVTRRLLLRNMKYYSSRYHTCISFQSFHIVTFI